MKSTRRIDSTGSAPRREALLGLPARAWYLGGFGVVLLAMVLAGLALWPATADAEEPAEALWSADMTVVEYTSVSIGAATADLFSNVGGSGNLQIKWLWSHKPDRDLRLAFEESVPNAADYTLQVGDLSLEFPEDSSGASTFKWNDVDVDWEDGQLIRARIVPTGEVEVLQANTPATGVPAISGTAQVGETLTADTSGIADEDGLESVSYAYQWMRIDGDTDANIADGTDSAYKLTVDDEGKTIKLKVSFIDDEGNSETLTSAATEEVSKRPEFLVSNLGAGVGGSGGLQRALHAGRSGFAQAFTTGPQDGGYALGSVGIQVSSFHDESTVGDHLQVTINGAASEGEPSDAHCTLTNPSSFPTPGVIAFEAPKGAGSCPRLATETTYFVVIEWLNPSGTDKLARVPQTYATGESAATDEDEGGAEGWSIADQAYYLTVSSDARTWTAYDETASFKIKVKQLAVAAAKANSPATGAPTISGTPQVGETLTADTSGIADEDGLDDVSYEYQWLADDTDIDGATGSSHTLTDADQGKAIKVKVSFTDDADNEESLTSEATDAVAARANTPATGLPTISGTAQVGETLTAATSGIADEDGLDDVSYEYQWLADDTDIDGATSSSYTLADDDQGKAIKVKVSFTDDAENEESLTSEATDAVAAAANSPATGLPTISGTAQVGETLTADTSAITDEDGLENVSYEYQWLADGANIARATGSSLTLTTDQQGKTIQVRVDFTDDLGNSESVTSEATEAVAARANTPATGLPTISGTPQVGETLTADTSAIADEDGLADVSYSYQWLAAGTDIAGATGSSHTLTDNDQGKTIKVEVSFTDDAENEESLTSEATDAVAARANTPATGLPTISGTAQVGETLTAATSGIADEDGLDDVSYEYQWLADDTDIDGATSSSYTLADDDQGKAIKVKVSFTDDAENEESLTSEATDAVAAAANSPATGLPTISGTAQVGETLTADTSAITDEDGLENVSYEYQWLADGANIARATGSSLTLTTDQQGKTIQVRVDFTDDLGNSESVTSEATEAVAARANTPATGLPTISGTPQVDQTLTADTSNIDDEDGLTNVSYRYQWSAGGSDIEGATGSTYTLTYSEQGQTIQVQVSFTDDANNEETLTSQATVAVAAAPNREATGQPTISGTPQVDQTLTADTSGITDADGLTNPTFAYQWRGGGLTIIGANSSTYTLTASDQGKTITVRVRFIDDRNSIESRISNATTAVAAAPNRQATGKPTIGGTPQVGETLTADTANIADEDGLTNVSYRYQWIADGTDLSGATGSSYELTSNEQGKTIQVRVSFTDDGGNSETLTSAATDAVTAKPTPLTASFSGVPESHDGQTVFTFELHFSEEFKLSYVILRDHAFTVTGGEITKAKRLEPGKNSKRVIHVRPDGDGAVTIVLPATTDCDDDGAICTEDDRMLSNSLSFAVSGPGQ